MLDKKREKESLYNYLTFNIGENITTKVKFILWEYHQTNIGLTVGDCRNVLLYYLILFVL